MNAGDIEHQSIHVIQVVLYERIENVSLVERFGSLYLLATDSKNALNCLVSLKRFLGLTLTGIVKSSNSEFVLLLKRMRFREIQKPSLLSFN